MSYIIYGNYAFPDPLPLIGESDEPIYISGLLDHKINKIDLIGNLTGLNLSGLHLQKMQMISGLAIEFQNLIIEAGNSNIEYDYCKPISITFQESNLSTFLPYSISFECYTNNGFANYFGVKDVENKWSYNEEDNKIISASHVISAVGVKVDGNQPLNTAINFVNSMKSNGFQNLSLFHSGSNAFLVSRNEDINQLTNKYSITENYKFSTSQQPYSNSGIVQVSTSIGYSRGQALTVSVNGSIFGSMNNIYTNSNTLTTGSFTPAQATQVATNAVISSLSSYEASVYSFISRGPKSYDYTINNNENKIDFSFVFADSDNEFQTGNVLHTYNAKISSSKDSSLVSVSVDGQLQYNAPFSIYFNSNDPVSGQRFKEINSVFSGISPYNIANKSLIDYSSVATGYKIKSSSLNVTPVNFSINKDANIPTISYSYQYDNRIDLSSGEFKNLDFKISDKKPVSIVNIKESLSGFAQQTTINKTLGEYSISLQAEESGNKLSGLKQFAEKYTKGLYEIDKNESISNNSITYTIKKYY
jgi:hypothetical protein